MIENGKRMIGMDEPDVEAFESLLVQHASDYLEALFGTDSISPDTDAPTADPHTSGAVEDRLLHEFAGALAHATQHYAVSQYLASMEQEESAPGVSDAEEQATTDAWQDEPWLDSERAFSADRRTAITVAGGDGGRWSASDQGFAAMMRHIVAAPQEAMDELQSQTDVSGSFDFDIDRLQKLLKVAEDFRRSLCDQVTDAYLHGISGERKQINVRLQTETLHGTRVYTSDVYHKLRCIFNTLLQEVSRSPDLLQALEVGQDAVEISRDVPNVLLLDGESVRMGAEKGDVPWFGGLPDNGRAIAQTCDTY